MLALLVLSKPNLITGRLDQPTSLNSRDLPVYNLNHFAILCKYSVMKAGPVPQAVLKNYTHELGLVHGKDLDQG